MSSVPSQPDKWPYSTYTGTYGHVRFAFSPEPPLTAAERFSHKANYPTTLAYFHIYLDGEAASQHLPSGYVLWILGGMLGGLPDVLAGGTATAQWFSDPWQFDLHGLPAQNQLVLTLHVPDLWVAIHAAHVPLDQFGREVLRVAHAWLHYLDGLYHDEMMDVQKGDQYRLFLSHLRKAEHAVRAYAPH
jgi:hypothetical protein